MQSRGMESHEWKENTDEGKRYYRANFLGGNWRILTTTMKRNPEWDIVEAPTAEVWRTLRELVWNKYQRKRCPWQRVESIDEILKNLDDQG